MKVQVTPRHFRSRIDYLLGTRERQLSLNVIVNGGSVRLGKAHWTESTGQASQDQDEVGQGGGAGKPTADNNGQRGGTGKPTADNNDQRGGTERGGTRTRWDRQAKITIGVKVHKSQIVHFSRSAEL
jgi:hypothetical protein